ncbi:c-type cytochrome [Tunicatimonas pelagia]|uniref:c-type cytochrome n=1 Tax=Tunicatimonas pelagia TaxID=931531 RepID=UPI0026669395|nr:cytochrome c [Tunicatimonas pelagia]WKN42618.1 cytochrome c [Tunicatimonas pelagia]
MRSNSLRWIVEGWLMVGGLLGCQKEENTALPAITSTEAFFDEAVTPIFFQNCNYCHSTEQATAGIVLDTYADARAVALNGQLLGAVNHVSGYTPMPLNAPQLPDEEIATIRRWVEAVLADADN